jgi:type II secretory pathway pseudopilin PulG
MTVEKKYQNKSLLGQTLIETLAALFILTMGVSAAVSLAIYAFGSSGTVLKQIIATGLAREGLEAVRNMRDTNWLQDTLSTNGCYSFTSGLPNSESCYTNWLGDKTGTAVPFCLNPVIGVATGVTSGQVILSVDDRYDSWFNGAVMGSGNSWSTAQVYGGLSFQPGKNVIAVKAINDGYWAGVLADVTIGGANSGSQTSWKYFKSVSPPPDQGGVHWYDVNYDDSTWLNTEDQGPYATTYPWKPGPPPDGYGPVINMPLNTPGHWIWDSAFSQDAYTLYIRGSLNNSISCSSGAVNTGLSYSLSSDSSSANYWTLARTDTNFGLVANTPVSSTWQQSGFYSPSGGVACNNSAGNSDYCRRVVLTKIDNLAPYSTAIGAGDTSLYLLQVQSQVWWVDKRCPRVATFDEASAGCKIELDSYLSNWKY